jgi:ATP-dependent exoDNAse (exonuclease V) beta subunit
VRAAITHSFRAVRELLAFVNDLCAQIDKEPDRPDAFRYTDEDAFPLASADAAEPDALGLAVAASDRAQAEAVAAEIARLLASGAMVRDRDTGVRRAAGPGDIGVLFRTREGHALFEEALARRRVPFYVYKGLGFFDADEVKDLLALVGFLARPQVQVAAAAFLRSRLVRLSDAALAALAPRLSEAIVDPIEPDAADRLDGYDRRRLQLARASVPRWLALVDRVPPAELVDRVLAESAYAAEIAGPSYRQARENVKKARMLIRRMQNRGYATLGRVADQLAGLAAGGDESNAIVDAADAVNLMTVHAAKGLEFPIVFLANLHRGSGGTPDPVRVVAAPFGQEDAVEPWVAIGEHRSGPERDIEARETEETKRLLYVALTRARDRLYLAATVPANGRFMGGRGGLGHMLPASMAATIGAAAVSTAADLVWTGPRGRHRFRLVRTSDDAPVLDRSEAGAVRSGDDFAPLTTTAVRRVTVTDLVAGAAANRAGDSRQVVEQPARSPSPGEAAGDALGGRVPGDLVGRLVHRAIEADLAGHTDDETEAHALDPAIDALIRDEERGEAGDRHALIDAVGRALRALRADPVVSSLVSGHQPGGWRGCEVPFSCRLQDGTIVRGTIDCLIEHAGGRVEVVEIKTGRPRPEDDAQLELYLEAARRLFPDAPVGGRVVYAGRS